MRDWTHRDDLGNRDGASSAIHVRSSPDGKTDISSILGRSRLPMSVPVAVNLAVKSGSPGWAVEVPIDLGGSAYPWGVASVTMASSTQRWSCGGAPRASARRGTN